LALNLPINREEALRERERPRNLSDLYDGKMWYDRKMKWYESKMQVEKEHEQARDLLDLYDRKIREEEERSAWEKLMRTRLGIEGG